MLDCRRLSSNRLDAEAFVDAATRRITFGEWAARRPTPAPAAARPTASARATSSPSPCRAASTTRSPTRPSSAPARSPPASTPGSAGTSATTSSAEAEPVRRRSTRRSTRRGIDGDPTRPPRRRSTRPIRSPSCGRAARPACPRAPGSTTPACAAMAEGGGADQRARRPAAVSSLPFAHVGAMTRDVGRAGQPHHDRDRAVAVAGARPPSTSSESERVTVCQGVPTQYRMMFDHPAFADRRHLVAARRRHRRRPRSRPSWSSRCGERLGCPVVVRYASTESCLATGTRLDDDLATITTTVGRPNGGVELKIVDDEGDELSRRRGRHGLPAQPGADARLLERPRAHRRGDRRRRLVAHRRPRLGRRRRQPPPRRAAHRDVHPRRLQRVPDRGRELPRRAPRPRTASPSSACRSTDRLGEIGVLFAVPQARATARRSTQIRTFVKERLADYKAPDRARACVDELPLTSDRQGRQARPAARTPNEEAAGIVDR